VVNKAVTGAAVTTLTPTSPFGSPVTFTATITATGAGSPGNPTTGSVTFYNIVGTTTTALGTVSLSGSNSVNFTTAAKALTIGVHTIKAVYAGNANFAASTTFGTQAETITKANANVAVTSSAASGTLTYGKTVTFTAIVSVASGSPGTPTGTVSFWNGPVGGTLLKANVTLVVINSTSAKATFTTTATQLTAGLHTITASFNATGNFAASSGALSYSVLSVATTTKLTSSAVYWGVNQNVVFTATVAGTSGGAPRTPTGTVTFDIDGVLTTVNMISGKATLSHMFATEGDHTVSATYNPATVPAQNFSASSAPPQTQNVRKATTVSMTSVSGTNGVKITAIVSTSAPGGPPTGTVSFYENGILIGTAQVVNGVAISPLLNLASGTHNITAVYSGDANFNPATKTQSIAGKVLGRLV
jgi:hypothetical protein